jgi:hypothetical protein
MYLNFTSKCYLLCYFCPLRSKPQDRQIIIGELIDEKRGCSQRPQGEPSDCVESLTSEKEEERRKLL